MTSAAAPQTPAARPTVVTVAVWFQAALVVLLLTLVAVTIADTIHYDGLIDQAARGSGEAPSEVAVERNSSLGWALVSGIPMLVLLVWLGVTLVWVRRGSNVARILTWVGLGAPIGLFLLSCLLGCVIGLFGLMAFGLADDESFDETELDEGDFTMYQDGGFYDRLYELDSGGWALAFDVIRAVTLLSAVLLAVATAVLLLTGPADRYFRPGRQRLPNPFPYAGMWPGYPGGAPPVHPAGPQWPTYSTPPAWGWPPAPPQPPWAPPAPPQPPWAPPGEDPPEADQKPPSQG